MTRRLTVTVHDRAGTEAFWLEIGDDARRALEELQKARKRFSDWRCYACGVHDADDPEQGDQENTLIDEIEPAEVDGTEDERDYINTRERRS